MYQFDRCSNDKFLENIENYVSDLIGSSASSTHSNNNNSIDSEPHFERRPEWSYLDLTPKQESFHSKSNEVSALRMKDEPNTVSPSQMSSVNGICGTTLVNTSTVTSTLADVVAVVGHVIPQPQNTSPNVIHVAISHMPTANNNQDLAEADQICTSDESQGISMPPMATITAVSVGSNTIENNHVFENEIGSNDNLCSDNIGAVGGNISCQLPDLAKVSTNTSRITSLEEPDASSGAYAEIEHCDNGNNIKNSSHSSFNRKDSLSGTNNNSSHSSGNSYSECKPKNK